MITVPVKIVKNESLAEVNMLPLYAKPGDAGCDGKANIPEAIHIHPGEIKLVPIGIAAAIPEGYEIQMRPRSGLALKNGITLLNSPGTIDSGYRNEIGAILINHSDLPFTVHPGDRICQLVLNKVETIQWYVVDELTESARGMGGYGHTGVVSEVK